MGKYQADNGKSAKPRKGKKPMGAGKKVLIGLLAFIVVAAAAVLIYINQKPAHASEPPTINQPSSSSQATTPGTSAGPDVQDPDAGKRVKRDGVYTILLAGTNDDYNTDTMMLCLVDTVADKATVVSLPRDTQIDIPDKYKRLNCAYGRGGMDDLAYQVKTITGVTVDFYCLVNLKSFIKVVDIIGGVPFYVPYNMYHADRDPSQVINLKKGQTVLDGKKALQLVRYRGTSASDFGRTQMQRDFLMAVAKKLVDDFSITQINKIFPTINESMKTNMPLNNMIWFYMNFLSKVSIEGDITWESLPYKDTALYKGQDYVFLDPEETVEFVNAHLNPYNKPITLDDVHISNLRD